MSVRVSSRVWELSQSTGTTKLVLLAIADCTNDEGLAWPSVTTIARKCGLNGRRSVQDHVKKLVGLGELSVELNTGRSGSNRYWVTVGNSKKIDTDTCAESRTGAENYPARDHAGNQRENPHGGCAESRAEPARNPAHKPSMNRHRNEREPSGQEPSPSFPVFGDVGKANRERLAETFPLTTTTLSNRDRLALSEAGAALAELSEEDWSACFLWFNEANDEERGCKLWPRSRTEFLKNANEAIEKVRTWWLARGKEWHETKKRRELTKRNTPPADEELPHVDFYEFLAVTGRDQNEAVAAWRDDRWKGEYLSWLNEQVKLSSGDDEEKTNV